MTEPVAAVEIEAGETTGAPAASQPAARYRSGPHFNEASCAEVTAECEGLGDSLAPHDLEAGGIDIRVGPLVMMSEPVPCALVDRRVHEYHRDPRRLAQHRHKLERVGVAGSAPKPCPGLTRHQIRRAQWPALAAPQLRSIGVAPVRGNKQADPERGVDESHRSVP